MQELYTKHRDSLLETDSKRSSIIDSRFRGFYNVAILFGILYILKAPVIRTIQSKDFFSQTLFLPIKNDFFACLSTWPLYYIWSYTSYFIIFLH